MQGPASAGATPGDAIPDQSAVPQAPPDDARHSAAAQVHPAALKRHTFTANSTENHSNVLDPGDSSTSGLTVQVSAEPATTPLMCMICSNSSRIIRGSHRCALALRASSAAKLGYSTRCTRAHDSWPQIKRHSSTPSRRHPIVIRSRSSRTEPTTSLQYSQQPGRQRQ